MVIDASQTATIVFVGAGGNEPAMVVVVPYAIVVMFMYIDMYM